MERFNLEEYLKNPSRKVVTRDGQAVKIYCTDYVDGPIIAKIEEDVFSHSFREDGRYVDYEETDYDLFFAPEKHDDMTQEECDREAAFAEWYRENGKGTPTYSDAIEWARKEVINKACELLKSVGVLTDDDSIMGFIKAMEE